MADDLANEQLGERAETLKKDSLGGGMGGMGGMGMGGGGFCRRRWPFCGWFCHGKFARDGNARVGSSVFQFAVRSGGTAAAEWVVATGFRGSGRDRSVWMGMPTASSSPDGQLTSFGRARSWSRGNWNLEQQISHG